MPSFYNFKQKHSFFLHLKVFFLMGCDFLETCEVIKIYVKNFHGEGYISILV